MPELYKDKWITCTGDALSIRGYYLPWGTKRIPYGSIRAVQPVDLATFRGRGRIWGTANPRYWAGLDPSRPLKQRGLVLDLGRPIRPLITPDDPDAVQACINSHSTAAVRERAVAPIV